MHRYLSHQNDGLRQELGPLVADVEGCAVHRLGCEAFGVKPDTMNFWFGFEGAVSRVHKDPYENLYLVVRGEKHFTLLPPTDIAFLYEDEFSAATYVRRPAYVTSRGSTAHSPLSRDGTVAPSSPQRRRCGRCGSPGRVRHCS